MKFWNKRSVGVIFLMNLFLLSNSTAQPKIQFIPALQQRQFQVELENNTSRHDLSTYLQDNPIFVNGLFKIHQNRS
jgi:hypothetical protein